MSIEEIILNYRNFLIISWACISEILYELDWDQSPYFLDEWMQANWELLVEKQIDQAYILASYGYDSSPECRYSDEDSLVTHHIVCWEKNNTQGTKYIFLCFVTKEGEVYKIAPPFNFVDVENSATGNREVLPLSKISFTVEQIE